MRRDGFFAALRMTQEKATPPGWHAERERRIRDPRLLAARVDGLAGDPLACVAGEEEDEAGGVFGLAEATEGHVADCCGLECFGHPAGVGAAWVDGVDGDAF